MTFKEIISNSHLLRILEELGFDTPTEIQLKAIPEVLKGADLLASAQTGTGKTAAFLLPALSRLAQPSNGKGPRVLILVPTRELAMQVAAEAEKLGRYLPHISTVCMYGGVPYHMQNRKLGKKFDILIATPGRLIDNIEQKKVQLGQLEMLILDEADRMLDMGFIEPVEFIASLTPSTRQTLLFSATFGKKVVKLAEKLLTDPVEVNVKQAHLPLDQIEQLIHRTDNREHKYQLLKELLADETLQQAIVFSSTKIQTEHIADQLCEDGFEAGAIHGDMNQRQRTRTMQQMRQGKIRILVATDVAARGIDVQTITHVINFDLPQSIEDYIHRIGRTGRAGAKGVAISFASYKDHALRKQIEQFMGSNGQTSAEETEQRPAKRKQHFRSDGDRWKRNAPRRGKPGSSPGNFKKRPPRGERNKRSAAVD